MLGKGIGVSVKHLYWRLREVVHQKKRSFINKGSRLNRIARSAIKNGVGFGRCPVCDSKTMFLAHDDWLREYYFCARCGSNSRTRAFIRTLLNEFPNYRELRIFESSPGGSSSDKLRRDCANYEFAHFYPDIPTGSYKNGIRCENLEKLTFPDNHFDIVVTQDVMEHVFLADKAFSEISRVLKPGGAHVFTVPYHPNTETVIRAIVCEGKVKYLMEAAYHGNPIDPDGALVVRDWGNDLPKYIEQHGGLSTTIHDEPDDRLGIRGRCLEVFVSRKSG